MLDREKMASLISGKGVVIDPRRGLIYRLSVAPDGRARVSETPFDLSTNTIVGAEDRVWDFIFPRDAIRKFNEFNTAPGAMWRKDDRVFYSREAAN